MIHGEKYCGLFKIYDGVNKEVSATEQHRSNDQLCILCKVTHAANIEMLCACFKPEVNGKKSFVLSVFSVSHFLVQKMMFLANISKFR